MARLSLGGAYFRAQHAKDIVEPYMKTLAFLLRLPNVIKWLAGMAARPFSPQAAIMCHSYVTTPEEVRRAQADYDDYAEQFLNK